jgi:hypothetical protein
LGAILHHSRLPDLIGVLADGRRHVMRLPLFRTAARLAGPAVLTLLGRVLRATGPFPER